MIFVIIPRITSKACQRPLGTESREIKWWQFEASSQIDGASADNARLNLEKSKKSRGAWIAKDDDDSAWLQVFIPHSHTLITAVATQGKENQWVTKYKLQYWTMNWKVQYYKDPLQSGPFKVNR